MNTRHVLAAIVAAAAFALTACTSTTPNTDPTPAPKPAAIDTTTTSSDDMTQAIVDLSWAQQTEDDKDAMCFGLALYGTDWGAEQMRIGAGNESVDWDRAAVLVEAKCAQR